MKYILSLVVTVIFGANMLFAQDMQRYKINVGDFEELTVVDGVPVHYVNNPDSAGWAVFESSPEVCSRIMFSNAKNHLKIQTDAEDSVVTGVPMLTVYSSSLKKICNSGDSLVVADVSAELEKFTIRQIGNGRLVVENLKATKIDARLTAGCGTLYVSGETTTAKFSNISSGTISAYNLVAENVSCSILGAGPVECTPSKTLKISGLGAGKVYYQGAPEKVSNKSLGVKAMPKSEQDETAETLPATQQI